MSRILYLTTIEFAPGALATLPEALGELGIGRPLLIGDFGHCRRRPARPRGGLPAGRHAAFPGGAAQPDGRRRWTRRSRSIAVGIATASSPSAAARRLTSPRAWRCSPPIPARWRPMRRSTAACPRSARRSPPSFGDPHHRRHGRRGRPRRAAHARRRPETRLHQPAPHPQARHLRPGADAQPAAGSDRRDRARRALALHRDVPLPALQSAGGGDRAGWRRPHLAQHRAAPPRPAPI